MASARASFASIESSRSLTRDTLLPSKAGEPYAIPYIEHMFCDTRMAERKRRIERVPFSPSTVSLRDTKN